MNDHPPDPPTTELRESDKAINASLTQKAFLSHLRHELRTPLNAMIGYSEMLLEDAAEQGQTDFIANLQEIHTASSQLLTRVNDSLDPEGSRLASLLST